MKKLLLSFAIASTLTSAFASVSITPSSFDLSNASFEYWSSPYGPNDGGRYVDIEFNSGTSSSTRVLTFKNGSFSSLGPLVDFSVSTISRFYFNDTTNVPTDYFVSSDSVYFVFCDISGDTPDSVCPNSTTLSEAQGSSGYLGDSHFSMTGTATLGPDSSETNSFTSIVASSSSRFTEVTGFSPSGAVSWMGTSVLKPIMGVGLSTLKSIIYWILALLAIAVITYVHYRALKIFYKH